MTAESDQVGVVTTVISNNLIIRCSNMMISVPIVSFHLLAMRGY